MRGFTLLDVLVAVAVIALLIAILAPTLSTVQETSRRVVCSSNLRQLGLGLQLYADDSRGQLPPSAFLRYGTDQSSEMMTLRLSPDTRIRVTRDGWDGLGILYRTEYLPTSGIFYCPSHHGDHPYEAYAEAWRSSTGEIVGNYHYRGRDSDGRHNIYTMVPETSLAADGMRTLDDYNHHVGLNVLRAGLHVAWLDDGEGSLAAMLANGDGGNGGSQAVDQAWDFIDSR
ncbi:MAG: type II secretion system protein [Planctomycetota bacterium]|nr:MAG: type II secretion system protein [Planctomycetota bacterium]